MGINSAIKGIVKAAIRVNIYLLKKAAALFRVEFDEFYTRQQLADKKLNGHLLAGKDFVFNMYTSHLPDRYNHNLAIYRQQANFFQYNGLHKWLSGNYDNNVGDIGRFFFLNLCIDCLLDEKINGNVAELGVYRGNSASLLAKYASITNTTCYLFDTFEGFDSRDATGLDANIKLNAFDDTSLELVKQNVGYDKHVAYVKGYFPESLEGLEPLDGFSLVHLDCDLEKPISAALDYFYPKLLKGGFLIIHDYSSLYWPGAKKAIDEFFANKPEFIIPIPDKSGSCVIRKM